MDHGDGTQAGGLGRGRSRRSRRLFWLTVFPLGVTGSIGVRDLVAHCDLGANRDPTPEEPTIH